MGRLASPHRRRWPLHRALGIPKFRLEKEVEEREVCAEVENGEQALVKARELNPDLIILDLAMPVMDGLRATREILRILPSVAIIIYTLHYAPWVELEAKKAGARGVVAKSD